MPDQEQTKDRLTSEEAKLIGLDVLYKNYEYVSNDDSWVRKSSLFGNPEDIVQDRTCDLSFLEGGKVIKTGFHTNANEGGLAIVYEKDGEEMIAVLGFTELGMWVYSNTKTNK
jgi:hypothetical protein